MSSFVLTPTSIEPVSLQDAKDHLRVSGNDDDELIKALVTAARQRCELETRTIIATAFCTFTLDGFPSDEQYHRHHMRSGCWQSAGMTPIELSRRGLTAINSITYIDENQTTQTLSPSAYRVDLSCSRIVPLQAWPKTGSEYGSVTVTATGGGNSPGCVRPAILLIVGSLYENRENVSDKQMFEVPTCASNLLAPLVWGSYP